MARVSVLPDHIASQIAAGEVVEKPASVVKELVENSIDAGARHIEVAVSNNCLDIRVADDGYGMEPEDALLAFQRHATSKISSAEDLSNLTTLGFRGEALPSIASISKFSCTTRTKEAGSGTRIEIQDGEAKARETGCAVGTVMEVRDLFFNVPARLKFLKKPNTEIAHIQDIVQSLAVAHPSISFELKKNDSTTFRTSGSGSIEQAAKEAKIFSGKETLEQVEASDPASGMRVKGFVARPTSFRGDRKGILTIVNNRPVRCPLTYRALDYAYSDLIPRGRHPLAVVSIEIEPNQIDVNIHPTKKEIKYADGNGVYMTLHRAIGDALRQPRKELIRAALESGQERLEEVERISLDQAPHLRHSERAPLSSSSYLDQKQIERGEEEAITHARTSISVAEPIQDYSPPSTRRPAAEVAEQLSFTPGMSFTPTIEEETVSAPQPSQLFGLEGEQDGEVSLPIGWRLAGYIHNTYFLFETPEGIEIVEQHIAHERLLYERLLAGQETRGRVNDNAQRLIVSAPLSLSSLQEEILRDNLEPLAKLGFEFEDSEDGSISCSQVPLQLAHQNYASVIQQMLDDIACTDNANFELEATKSLACQAAIKNGMHLSREDILRLVTMWLDTPRNDTCPHGRPVRLKFTRNKLFQLFHPA